MSDNPNVARKHRDIRIKYQSLSNEKEFGVQKYSSQRILAQLAHDFYISVRQIERIVFTRHTA